MIEILFGRYAPTVKVAEITGVLNRNLFTSEIHDTKFMDLTSALREEREWLDSHFGFVLLYSNGTLIQRTCNFRLFKKTFDDMNILVELQNHIGV